MMKNMTGFLEFDRKSHQKRLVEHRVKDYNEQIIPLNQEDLKQQAARCMNCGVPFCQSGIQLNHMTSGCPLHNLIPEWNDLVSKGQMYEAYQRLVKTNPFPEFTSRVCPAPCEGSCTNGIHYQPVAIKSIEYEISEYAFKNGYVRPYSGMTTGKKVAIIGSGPAGLSAAHYLSHVGHLVTVFEKKDKPGGLLQYGIPSMKLGKQVVDRRIELLTQSNVTFVCNTEVGKDITVTEIENDYDAVLITIGTQIPRDINVPGRELHGVYFALDFLEESTKSYRQEVKPNIDAKEKDVVIIGGGDTATDCVATCVRQGATSVSQLEILPQKPQKRDDATNPWPEYPKVEHVDYGQEEALFAYDKDPRMFTKTVTKLIGNTHVEAVEIAQVNWKINQKKEYRPELDMTTKSIQNADLVLVAIGYLHQTEFLQKFSAKSKSNASSKQEPLFETTKENLFIAGDFRRGQSLVVWALEEGKLVSREIDRFLMGHSLI